MIERIIELAARIGGGVGTTKWSFVRILAWTVAFVVLVSLLVPSRVPTPAIPATPNARVHNVALANDDQRSFTQTPSSKRHFRIAWISGSEGQVFAHGVTTVENSQYLASSVVRSLPKIDGRTVVVDVYDLPAMRVADAYFALLDAIRSKPDMIVMSLNPVFTLNPIAAHQWMQLDGDAARQLSTHPDTWPIAASLLSPSDLMWGVASKLQPFEDRSSYNVDIHDLVDDLGPLDRSDLTRATAAQHQQPFEQALGRPPVNFWLQHRLHLGTALLNSAGWARLIAESNKGTNALNKMVLRATARALRSSKIPSYVYLAQVNRRFLATNHAFAHAVGEVEGQLRDMRKDFVGPGVIYRPETATRDVRGSLTFVNFDAVHLSTAGAMGPYLARELCRLARQVGTTCS
jgi:hypothetical protein